MEKSADQDEIIAEVIRDNDLRTPEPKNVRRRLIQSTLFPQRSHNKDNDIDEKPDNEDCNEGDDEGEEHCGSQSKIKKRPKRKATPASKKKFADKQVTENDNDASGERVNQKSSPTSAKTNFFVRASNRRPLKKQDKEHETNESPERTNNMCSPPEPVAYMRTPQKSKQRHQGKSTPTKSPKTNGKKVPQISNSPICEHLSQPIPDLRLEAKLTAVENSRLFAGRQIHPFFSSRKSTKNSQEVIEVESYTCSVDRKDRSVALGPIHIFETPLDEAMSFDWKNWIFHGKTFPISICAPKSTLSSIFDGSVGSLNIDQFHKVTHLPTASFLENKTSIDTCSIEAQCSSVQAASATLSDEMVACYQLPGDTQMGCEGKKIGISTGHAGNVENLDADLEKTFSQERFQSHYICSNNLPRDILWTEKYQPEKAIQVCGNSESVKFLNEWLHLWHEKGFRTRNNSANDDKCSTPESDNDSDCDSENSDDDAKLKNVILITGPVGSGKSAAIYACAKEQGFKVIEVNTSDWRNGALVKQNFREAVESHRLKWSSKNQVGSQSKCTTGSSQALPNASQDFDNEVIELIPLSDEEDCFNGNQAHGKENTIANGRDKIKSLVLFEDVDITFTEDRGFIAAIQHLSETAKLPMILTTNSNSPVLPENFDRLELYFEIPSPVELLNHVQMVCDKEKASINHHLREKFVDSFNGDIRKIITHLQFWCQGKRDATDSKVQGTYAPLRFDIFAGHHILPKIVPWEFPSQLSELIENEISKSLSNIEQNINSMTGFEQEQIANEEIQKQERDEIEAKKEAILKSCSFHDYNEFQTPIENIPTNSDSSGSPVAFTRRNVRKKTDHIFSFGSDDESYDEKFHQVYVQEKNKEMNFNFDSSSIPFPQEIENGLDTIESEKVQESNYECSIREVEDTCGSVDVSCVPKSAFVPESTCVAETEMNDEAEMNDSDFSSYHTHNIELIQNLSPVVQAEDIDKPLSRLRKRARKNGYNSDEKVESNHREEFGDSQIEHGESVTIRGYQMMDECSRIDLNRTICFSEKPESCAVTDSVQETWSKLRGNHEDLRQHVTLEQKHASEIVKLAFEFSSLISDADILLSNRNILTSDSMDPAMFAYDESDASDWYNEQVQMTSLLTEHGFCLYAKDIVAKRSTISSNSSFNLVSEMLASTNDTIALGKLIGQERKASTLHTLQTSKTKPSQPGISLRRKAEAPFYDIVESLVPSKAYMTLKGEAFHEYLSSLAQISRSEDHRLSSGIPNTTRRRGRAARHYLSIGALGLSPDEISSLNQYNGYGKCKLEID